MAKFEPGQQARLIKAHPDWRITGAECVILHETPAPPEPPEFSHETWYAIHIPGYPSPSRTGNWTTAESTLEPILDARSWFEQSISIPAQKKQEPIDA